MTWSEMGELRERLRIVRKQLEWKFKRPLDPAIQERLAKRTPEELDRLTIDLLSANSLRELGLED
jgi:hypothetical protein